MSEILTGEENRCYLCGDPIPDDGRDICDICEGIETAERD